MDGLSTEGTILVAACFSVALLGIAIAVWGTSMIAKINRRRTRIEVFADKKHEWRWHKVAGNNRILSDSGEGFRERGYALNSARSSATHNGVRIPIFVQIPGTGRWELVSEKELA